MDGQQEIPHQLTRSLPDAAGSFEETRSNRDMHLS